MLTCRAVYLHATSLGYFANIFLTEPGITEQFFYLTVSVVILICWWVCVGKINDTMLGKEWFVKLGESESVLWR